MINPDIINEIAAEIGERTGAERRAVVARYAGMLGVSEQTIYRNCGLRIADCGLIRIKRRDAGEIRVGVSEEQLETVAAILMESWDEKDTIKMPAAKAIQMAEDSGVIPSGALTACTFNRWLKRREIAKDEVRRKTPHIQLRTTTVNDLHEYDTSQCRQWYVDSVDGVDEHGRARTGTDARIGWQRWDYKNKPLKGLPLKRHLITDHFSGAFFVMYLPSEDCAASLEFLFSAWQRKSPSAFFAALGIAALPEQIERAGKIAEAFPFLGTPRMLYTDNGSIVKSAVGKQALERMRIEYKAHRVGNAQATGSVEVHHNIWESWFETELRRKPATSLVELNLRAFEYAARFQQERRHSRHGMTRFGLFTTEAQRTQSIRELPEDRALLRTLAMRADVQREIKYNGVILWDGVPYCVADQSLWGKKAMVGPDIFNYPDLFVRCEGKELILKAPTQVHGGFYENSVAAGEYRAVRQTETQIQIKEIAKIDLDQLRTADCGLRIEKMDIPRGTQVELNAPVVERIYSRIQAKHEAASRLGYQLLKWQIEAIEMGFGDRKEVRESELEEIIRGLTTETLRAQSL